MPKEYAPYAEVIIGDMASAFGILLEPPLVYPVPMQVVNAESKSSISGRYKKHKGQAVGYSKPKTQDTFLFGTAMRTGRAFTVVSGTWTDTSKAYVGGAYRLLMADGSAGVAFEVVSHDPTANIENAQIVIGRGSPLQTVTRSRANYNTYVHLCYGQRTDYRIAMEFAAPIRLEITRDGGATWAAVGIARDLGDWNTYLRNNHGEIVLRVAADYNDNSLTVEVGNGELLYHAPDAGNLPTVGNIRVVGQNGFCYVEYYPLRHEPVTVNKGERDFGRHIPNLAGATVATNGLAATDSNQQTSASVTTDGQKVTVQASAALPDAGDGQGSAGEPTLSDFMVISKGTWADELGGEDPRLGTLPTLKVAELQVFDTITRTKVTSAQVTASNRDAYYAGAYGHVAGEILAANTLNGALHRRLVGIGGVGAQGVVLRRNDPVRLIDVPFSDRSYAMGRSPEMPVPLEEEVIFDQWCLYSAARFLGEIGNIHPRYMQSIPLYVPPNASLDAPYGPAGYDCPPDYPILPRGTGLNAKFRELPDRTPWNILQELVQDSAVIDPYTGGIAPFYTGFDADGNLHFEPIFWSELDPVITYSSYDPTGIGQIESIEVFNSISQMRTVVDLQGIDPRTYELLYLHLPLPAEVLRVVGFRCAYMDRSARYSGDYMAKVGQAAVALAGMPQEVYRVRVPFQPWVHAGNLAWIQEEVCIGGSRLCVIEELYSVYGIQDVTGRSGFNDCFSVATMRPLENITGFA